MSKVLFADKVQTTPYNASKNNAADVNELKNAINDAIDIITGITGVPPVELNSLEKIAARLNALAVLVEGTTPDADNLVNRIQELLQVFANFPEGVLFLDLMAAKVDKAPGFGLSEQNYTLIEKNRLNALGQFNPTDYANNKFFETANGMYYPLLTPGSFDNPSANATNGLASHPNGGVVAAVAGTAGSGSSYLPIPIDPSKPFNYAVLVEINDSQTIDLIHFANSNADYRTGLRATSISTTRIDIGFAGNVALATGFGVSGGIPAGTKIWMGLISDGFSGVYAYIMPDVAPLGFNFSGGAPQNTVYSAGAFAISVANDYLTAGSGINAFGGSGEQVRNRLCRFMVTTKSTQNRIIGVWINQGLDGPGDGRLTPPAMFKTTILQDKTAIVIRPKKQGSAPVDLVMLNHQNAFGTESNWPSGSASGIALGKIFNAGYMAFGLDGIYGNTTTFGTEATQSNWGAPTGMKYRKAFWDWIRSNMAGTRKIFELGCSMGFLNSLRLSIQYPNQIAGIIGIGGVCDLTDCFNNRAFGPVINKAYSAFYAALTNSTGIIPGQVVQVTTAAVTGATSLAVAALTSAIPSGTTLTLVVGLGAGPTTVVTTAAAAANATSIQVAAITADIPVTQTTRFDMRGHWLPINFGFGQPDELFYKAPYVWRDTFAAATAYVQNNIVCVTNNGTAKTYQFVDPVLNPNAFKNIPLLIFHGDADTLIPIAQAQNFSAAVNAIGGGAQLVTVPGGTHLGDSTYKGDDIVTWLNARTA